MAKDPTFPFYASDYLVDTIRWSRGMKSLHVDLLAESWINGGLEDVGGHPRGLEGEDLELWGRIKHKWEKRVGFWVNAKLEETRTKRERFRAKQTESGKKGGRPKKAAVANLEGNDEANPFFEENPEETQPFLFQNPNESLLEKENENEKEIEKKEGVVGETVPTRYLIPEMLAAWKKHSPDYPEDRQKDFEALRALAEFLCNRLEMPYNPRDGDVVVGVLAEWEKMAEFACKHDFFKNYSLQQVKTHSQNIFQSLRNGRKTNQQNLQPGGLVIPAGPREYGKL
ncbi:hypothetical protein HF324_18510 [Chitinophaga oryzae]|uniref:DUF1376 domain-containing protein n=1 Tax=Chitinophaga oryzae TaxID=2725414 RepID=A0ABX6LIQ0_9BACT|nr:hypothetical protein [Chitinophaga oryzae]QJB39742.1 hypothetical protein HF324_18510 [Chitinophaga oryzae]